MVSTIQNYLNSNGYSHLNSKDIELQLKIHPDFPSIKAITDTLDYFGIKNIAANIPPKNLKDLPDHFISMVKMSNQKVLVFVTKGKNFKIVSENKIQVITIEEFKEIWIPTVIVSENNSDVVKKKISFTKPAVLFVILASFTFIFTWIKTPELNSILFLFISISGILLNLAALKEEIGENSSTLNKMCNVSKYAKCKEIIKSNTKILYFYSFADIGLTYFMTLTVFFLLFGLQNSLTLLVLASTPLLGYSLIIQTRTKRFCPLCTFIIFLDILLITIIVNFDNFYINPFYLTVLMAIGIFFSVLIVEIKSLIVNFKNTKNQIYDLTRFKRNFKIFEFLLSNSSKVINDLTIKEIILGNKQATVSNTLIAISNPFCGYCEEAFFSYLNILKINPEIKIILRFNVDIADLSSPATRIALKLFEINFLRNEEHLIQAYTEWFRDRDTTMWFKKYGEPQVDSEFIQQIKKQNEWALKNNLNYTPVTVVGEKLFPKQYGYKDFTFFIQELSENKIFHSIPA